MSELGATSAIAIGRPPDGLAVYDPVRGLKTVVVAEAAEKHWRRAKDATQLLLAIESKLEAQRDFVAWWDQQEKQAGRRTNGVADSATPLLTDLGIDKFTLHRWRARLKDPRRYAETVEAAKLRALELCERYKGGLPDNSRSLGTGQTERYTPSEYVDAARDVLGAIDLDPASSDAAQRTVCAGRYFTLADNGLAQAWHGRVWLNPPYLQPTILEFIEKLVSEYAAGRTTAAILLTHNLSDTLWFRTAAAACSALCLTAGRIAFERADGFTASPTQGQAFFYYGRDRARFARRFESVGTTGGRRRRSRCVALSARRSGERGSASPCLARLCQFRNVRIDRRARLSRHGVRAGAPGHDHVAAMLGCVRSGRATWPPAALSASQ